MSLSVALTNEEKIKITASPQTQGGRPAQVDGPIRGTVVSGEVTVQQVDGEPNSLYIVSGDNPGSAEVLVEADADLGEGVTLLQDTVQVEVSGAQAVSFGLTAGAPEPK